MAEEVRINGIPLREHVEALMEEHKRQLDTASQEREKSAMVLRDAQYRAMEQAEREREKSALVMRNSLDRSIQEGDERLREHIANQIQQIKSALESAEKLEIQRLTATESGIDGLRREMTLITDASKQAVSKAEDAQKDVNQKSNEFRGQLSDQAATLMARSEAEARTKDLDRRIEEARNERVHQIETIDKRIQALERGESGHAAHVATVQRQEDRVQPWQLWVAGFLISAVVITANFLAT